MKTTIYYFTGTGNSLKIARDISGRIPGSELRHIAAALKEGGGAGLDADVTGIVFPVYVEGLPVIVERFVHGMDISPDAYIFAVANYGGSAGGSLVQLEQILQEKGRRLSAAFGLQMPDNTQILFPPGSEAAQRRAFVNEANAVESIARTVSRGEEAGGDLLAAARRAPRRPWQRPSFDPGDMARKFTVDEKCDGCGICERVCPMANVNMRDSRPSWGDRCEQCLACMQWCPRQAVQFGPQTSGWGRYHHPDVRVEDLYRSSLK